MPWWIDMVALIVGFVVVGLATIRLIAGHYTREIGATDIRAAGCGYL